jgi:hypothetical protein
MLKVRDHAKRAEVTKSIYQNVFAILKFFQINGKKGY